MNTKPNWKPRNFGVTIDGRYECPDLILEPSSNNEISLRFRGLQEVHFFNQDDLVEAIQAVSSLMDLATDYAYCRDCGGSGTLGDRSICTSCEGSGHNHE